MSHDRWFGPLLFQMSHYRFSISWSRVFPEGTASSVNQGGIDYYNNLIDALIDADIVPMVTIYHSDLPMGLYSIGGWMNETVIEHFKQYAETLFREFGDRVSKDWKGGIYTSLLG